MRSETTTVNNPAGLHARSAATVVKLAAKFRCSITFENAGKTASANNIMALLMLEATKGSQLKISVEGPDEDKALAAMTHLININFGESGGSRERP